MIPKKSTEKVSSFFLGHKTSELKKFNERKSYVVKCITVHCMIYMKPCVPARYALGSAALLTRKGRKGGERFLEWKRKRKGEMPPSLKGNGRKRWW